MSESKPPPLNSLPSAPAPPPSSISIRPVNRCRSMLVCLAIDVAFWQHHTRNPPVRQHQRASDRNDLMRRPTWLINPYHHLNFFVNCCAMSQKPEGCIGGRDLLKCLTGKT